jgi:endonuclease/exonuclease/phosphatase family metal-dependent hydrolase
VDAVTLATWNLERPALASWKRLPAIRAVFAELAADVWVLTESRTSISPDYGFSGLHSPPHPARRPDTDERWVSVWSRWQLEPVEQAEQPWSVTGIVHSPVGPVLVRGVVLPYHAEPDGSGAKAIRWGEFLKVLEVETNAWTDLRRRYPSIPLIIAGDFNQHLDGVGNYGDRRTRGPLLQAIERAGLRCLTDQDVVAAGKLSGRLVDHICVSEDLDIDGDPICRERWTADANGHRIVLSDHPLVGARLTMRTLAAK